MAIRIRDLLKRLEALEAEVAELRKQATAKPTPKPSGGKAKTN
jgi:hypothetical protein